MWLEFFSFYRLTKISINSSFFNLIFYHLTNTSITVFGREGEGDIIYITYYFFYFIS